ncbi:MAG: PAS domain S-box protein [Deltaproteobacteria bacterium]|nr:MAG: PAS domain S-box protein [Deltaproteobacteria bacterium]
MVSCRFIGLLVWAGVWLSASLVQAQTSASPKDTAALLDANTRSVFLKKHVSYAVEGKDASLSLRAVVEGPFAQQFRPVPAKWYDKSIPRSKTPQTWWFRMTVRLDRSLPVESLWVLDSGVVVDRRRMTVFVCPSRKGTSVDPKLCKTQGLPFPESIHPAHLFYLQRLPGKSHRSVVLYIRLQQARSLPWTLRTAKLWRGSSFQYRRSLRTALQGLYFGLMLVLILVNFFFFVFQRDWSYLWYSLFQLSVVAYLFTGGPLGLELMGRNMEGLFIWNLQGLALGSMVMMCVVFSRSFLNTKEEAPLLDKLLLVLGGIAFVYFVGIRMSYMMPFLPRLMGMLGAPVVILAGLVCWRRGNRAALYYLVAQGAFVLSSLLLILEVMDLWPFSTLGVYWMNVGSGVEAVVLSLALIERVRVAQEERSVLERAKLSAETTARTHEQRLDVVLDAVNGGIWDWDFASETFHISPTYLERLGFDPVVWDFSVESFATLIHPDDTSELAEILQQYAQEEEGIQKYDAEFRLNVEGEWRWVLAQGSVVERNSKGEPARMVGTFLDVSERKQAQERLSRTERMAALGQLMTGIAHEINNPNNFITFNLPLLKQALHSLEPVLEEYAEDNPGWRVNRMTYTTFLDETYKLIDNMRYGASRITTLVSELRTFVRSQRTHSVQLESIEEVADKVMTLVNKRMEQMVERFEVDISPDLPKVRINAGKIEQVLINLLLNAGQAAQSHDESAVSLRISTVELPAPSVQIKIEDNGDGIPKEILSKVFDPFFTTKATDEGTGLGLAISHKIVEDHGGHIHIDSEYRKGTCVTVLLPMEGKTTQLLEAEAKVSKKLSDDTLSEFEAVDDPDGGSKDTVSDVKAVKGEDTVG